jgi:hypothetical protein
VPFRGWRRTSYPGKAARGTAPLSVLRLPSPAGLSDQFWDERQQRVNFRSALGRALARVDALECVIPKCREIEAADFIHLRRVQMAAIFPAFAGLHQPHAETAIKGPDHEFHGVGGPSLPAFLPRRKIRGGDFDLSAAVPCPSFHAEFPPRQKIRPRQGRPELLPCVFRR